MVQLHPQPSRGSSGALSVRGLATVGAHGVHGRATADLLVMTMNVPADLTSDLPGVAASLPDPPGCDCDAVIE